MSTVLVSALRVFWHWSTAVMVLLKHVPAFCDPGSLMV